MPFVSFVDRFAEWQNTRFRLGLCFVDGKTLFAEVKFEFRVSSY